MLEEHRVHVPDVELNYAEGPPNGSPLVLLHGGSNRWQRWEPILPQLAARWHVFAPDLRGHGGSSWTPGAYSIRSFTDDIVAFLERVVRQPGALFGHSLGAEIAVWAAARLPDRVRAAVVGDGPFKGPEARPRIMQDREQLEFQQRYAGTDMEPAALAGLMPSAPFRDESGGSLRARDFLGDEHPEYVQWAEMLRALDPTFIDALWDYERFSAGYGLHLLPDITGPVLILRAGRGGVLPRAEAEEALHLLADARLTTLDVGHGMHWVAPDLVLSTVLSFLEEALYQARSP